LNAERSSLARKHWDDVFQTKSDVELSWHQSEPDQSVHWIMSAVADRAAAIVDVGGGSSRFVDALLSAGYLHLTVLDISAAALERSKARLGRAAENVAWIATDITAWRPDRTYRVWHDRAVFHFLTRKEDQDAYLSALKAATVPGSLVIIATFALTGPERCSGLPVQRYDQATLAARLGPDFTLRHGEPQTHITPAGKSQQFLFALFERRS
jgi:hypothetical protein